jgi:hypothetical protein
MIEATLRGQSKTDRAIGARNRAEDAKKERSRAGQK